jgi:hypothetical protein
MSLRSHLNHVLPVFTGGRRRGMTSDRAIAPARRRPLESGFAFLLALMILVVMTASIITLLEIGATQRQRAREEETIWRGNQYLRAIRLFYHKTGRYPQTMDDLVKGMPQLRFLRQQYKDPMDPAAGDWRLIYVNQAGQIIGSTKYATLQQMALIDLNGGVMPGTQQIPGQPGIPVSALSNSGSNSDSSQGQNPTPGAGSGGAGTTDGSGNPTQPGSTPNSPNGQPPQSQDPSQPGSGQPSAGGQNPLFGSAGAGPGGILSGLPGQAPGSTGQNGSLNQTNVAALTALKPTGPVDGPVLGAFLTGVACTGDRKSVKVYHGGKKYVEWEFIWNPLEDAAAAQQQQASSGQAGILGGTPAGAGGNTGSTGSSFGSSFGSSPSNPGQPSQPQPQQPQTPQQ